MNHCYQIIQGKKIAVIHEYAFGVLSEGYAFPLSELSRHARCVPKGSVELKTIHTSDSQVIRQSAVPDTKLKNIIG